MGDTYDVVVVGGGIAGSALARTLANADLSVLVLERQERFRDRVRGECMMPWGVVEATRLGVVELLLDAGGGFVNQAVGYDETVTPTEAEQQTFPLGIFAENVSGFLDVGHPQASEALSTAASAAGATVVRGVVGVDVTAGAQPSVRYDLDGVMHEASCRIVIGADGRASSVRKQLGIDLHETEARTMLSGLLVTDLDAWPVEQTTLGTFGDVHYLVFPRPAGVARLYLAHDIADKDRFTGPDRVRHFLDAFRVDSLPLGEAIAAATPAGPCAGHPGTDTWTDQPFREGAVLVGDAAGWSDPLIGQGLSVALRDARTVADVLLEGDDWSPAAFVPYGEERAERMRRLRIVVSLMTDLRCDFSPAGRARRLAFFSGLLSDASSIGVMLAMMGGPEVAEPEIFDRENVDRIHAMA
jgi:2-polyprenyl-6-methoxyphenol hydroxylase-like FAD-dependent oxidoreductase